MSLINSDYPLRVARGLVSGVTSIHVFGASPDGVQTTATDIWTRADASTTQQIWLAPTAARIHAIVSSSTDDDSAGIGARTIRVYGLTTWGTAETTEDVVMDGTTPVNTANLYVMINSMKVLTSGTSINVGTITATAATDTTITAVIPPLDGQTRMAIYGVPSTQSLYITRWSGSVAKASVSAAHISFEMRVNENPNVQTTNYIHNNDLSVQSTGSSSSDKPFTNPLKYAGPCIIKIQGIASANDIDAKSAFDGYLVTN